MEAPGGDRFLTALVKDWDSGAVLFEWADRESTVLTFGDGSVFSQGSYAGRAFSVRGGEILTSLFELVPGRVSLISLRPQMVPPEELDEGRDLAFVLTPDNDPRRRRADGPMLQKRGLEQPAIPIVCTQFLPRDWWSLGGEMADPNWFPERIQELQKVG